MYTAAVITDSAAARSAIRTYAAAMCCDIAVQDRTFLVPRAVIAARICTPAPYDTPENAVLCRLYTALLKQDLNSYAYDATTGAYFGGAC